MEVVAETPPPLPPKTKKPPGAAFAVANASPLRRSRAAPNGILDQSKESSVERGPSQVAGDSDTKATDRVIAWGISRSGREQREDSEDLYENVSNGGLNYLERRLESIVSGGQKGTKGAKRKTPKIEVRQEENKTVVKISIKDTPSPEEEMSEGSRFEGVHSNGFACSGGEEDEVTYENVAVGRRTECENSSDGFYENAEKHVYVNGSFGRSPRKELRAEAKYCGSEGGEFGAYGNCALGIIGRHSVPPAKDSSDREDDDSYENVKADYRIYANENLFRNAQKPNETAEKDESGKSEKKSSVVEVFLQRPTMAKVEKTDAECADDNSSGDPFDSGTCSDADSLPTFVQGKKGNVIVTIKSLGEDKSEEKKTESGHGRAESLTSSGVGVDSEESDDEKSNISCDSLNSNEPYAQPYAEDHGYHTPNSDDKTGSPVHRIDCENVVDETDIIRQVADASRKIKNLRAENAAAYAAKLVPPSDFEDYENVYAFDPRKTHKKKAPPLPPPARSAPAALSETLEDDAKKALPKSLLRDIRSRNVRLSAAHPSGENQKEGGNALAGAILGPRAETPSATRANAAKHFMVEEKTYEERKSEGGLKVGRIRAMEVDTDKFYKFHLAENVRDAGAEGDDHHEETFAGVKNFLCSEKPAAITSAKGTIRGVKNRVKAGIATFLQLHENKSYKDRDAGKVVVYTTTMGIVRDTYHKCLKVKQILRTLMVKFEERDVFMSAEAQEEIRDRMKCNAILVPQVFVEGQHIGDAETIDRLNEMGELRTILKPYKSADACSTCKVCGGYRLLPCSVCKGSKKSIHRNHFTAEFVALKCMNCDQVGLTKCNAC